MLHESISPAAQKVVDLAAEADIEDVMLCDLPGVLPFLGLPPETEMPPGREGEAQEALQEGGAVQGVPLRRARQGLDLAPRHGRDQGIGIRPARRDRQGGRKQLM